MIEVELIIFLAIFVLIITYLIHAELYFRRLHRTLPDLFANLGSPSVIGKRQNPLPIFRFFVSKQYKQLPDQGLVNMGSRLVIHFSATFIAFISFLIFLSLNA
jgi:hypothetical protein